MSIINSVITEDGSRVQLKRQLGNKIDYTRIVMGDGYLPDGVTLRTVKEVAHPVISLGITKLKINNNATAVIGGVFSNADIDKEFFYRELALMAYDPDVGEVVYCYGNAGDYAERISASGGSTVTEKIIDIITIIDPAEKVTAVIDTSKTPTFSQVEDMIGDKVTDTQNMLNGKIENVKQLANDAISTANNAITTAQNNKYTHPATHPANMIITDDGMTAEAKLSKNNVEHIEIHNEINRAISIAKGTGQARVFPTVVALDEWLLIPENVAELEIGDNFYIVDRESPDYWWDGEQKQELGTQKIDLTEYPKTPEVQTMIEQALTGVSTQLSDMAKQINSIAAIPFTLSASAWVSSALYDDYPYQAALTVPGLTAGDLIRADFDAPSLIAATEADVMRGGDTEDGIAIFYAQKTPEVDLSGMYTIHKAVS